MTRDEIEALLLKILNDPAFRAALEADPVAALAAIGITLDPSEVPPGGVVLPSDDDIRDALDELLDEAMAAKASIGVLLALGLRP